MKLKILFLLVLKFTTEISAFDDALCDRQINHFRNALANPREQWAKEMFDYWAKIQSGLSVGNTQNIGHFDECVRFRHHTNVQNVGMIQGQHCRISHTATAIRNMTTEWNPRFDWREIGDIIRASNINLNSGICVPASCSPQKVVDFANSILVTADLVATNANCRTNDPFGFSWLDILAIVLFSIFAIILTTSTIYDIYMTKNSEQPNKLLTSFSLYTNGWQLCDMVKDKSNSSINSIHGIRALSVLWVVMGHRRFFHLFLPLTNANEVNNWLENIRTVIYQTDHLAVDIFFVMGGLLLVISFMNDLDKKRVSIWRMYLKRYLRYTPVLAVIILYQMSLMKFHVFGPLFNFEGNTRNCASNWWAALLHIQNYLDFTRMCVGHSWYLSADFQLFLVSPLLIYPAWKFGWKFLWTFPFITVLTVIYIFIMAWIYEVPVFYLRLNPDTSEIFHRFIYFPTHARMGPWFLGMTVGYIIYKSREEKIKLSKTFYSIMWIISLSTIFAVILGFHPFMQMNNNTTGVISNAIYLATFRNAFAFGVCWMIFACHNGTGGIIRWFLSLPQWQPIGRMGLSIYLIHPIYQSIIISGQKQAIHFSEITLLHAYFGDIIVVVFLGAALYLTFEIPLLNIESYFSKRKQAQS